MCNEIKLAIIHGHSKNQDETKFYLDQLTYITEVCQVKSKVVNPSMINELIGCQKNQKQQDVSQTMKKRSRKNKKGVLQNPNKTNNLKSTSNCHGRVFKYKSRMIHQRPNQTAVKTGNNVINNQNS